MLPATAPTAEDQRLVQLDVARQSLATAKHLPEVKQIRDMAAALQQYAKQQQYSLEVQNDAAELKLRAERKAGALLRGMDLATAAPGNQYTGPVDRLHDETGPPTLAEMAISKTQSHRWQQEASLPEAVFEAHIATTRQRKDELTSTGVYELARAHAKAARRQDPLAHDLTLQDLATQFAGLDDLARLEALGISVQPYDVLTFASCDPRFGTDAYPGRIPGQLVAHVLYWYTKPGDVVLDPMAGGGTVPDVCLVMGRTCYAYDLTQSERPDIMPHNLATDGWPERTKRADLIFWDPPYFKKKDEEYPDGSISRLDRGAYLAFFGTAFAEARQVVKPGTRLVLVMSDWNDDHEAQPKRPGIFFYHYANLMCEAGWHFEEHIQVPLSTQQVDPRTVLSFRAKGWRARLERCLLIASA
jgi:hypothetical protein